MGTDEQLRGEESIPKRCLVASLAQTINFYCLQPGKQIAKQVYNPTKNEEALLKNYTICSKDLQCAKLRIVLPVFFPSPVSLQRMQKVHNKELMKNKGWLINGWLEPSKLFLRLCGLLASRQTREPIHQTAAMQPYIAIHNFSCNSQKKKCSTPKWSESRSCLHPSVCGLLQQWASTTNPSC